MKVSEKTFIKIKEFTTLAFTTMANIVNGSGAPKRNNFFCCIRRINRNVGKKTTKD